MKKLTILKALTLSSLLSFACFPAFAGTVTPADAKIIADIHANFAKDKAIAKTKVEVTSHEGNVELKGNVKSAAEADKLIEIAQSTADVKDVDTDQLKIKKSKHPMNDAATTAKVKGLFIREKLFGDEEVAAMTIKVETTDGVVTLSGVADNQDQIDNATKLAQSVKNVKSVASKVELKK